MRVLRCLAIACLAVIGGNSIVHGEPVQGFAEERPEGCKPLPETIYVSQRFKGRAPTNQWFSSLVWEKHSQNMFPHPMGVVFGDSGLSLAYPGAAMVSSADSIMGGGVSSNGDIVIGHSEIVSADSTHLDSNSQWFITGVQESGDAVLRMTIGHGSPFVFCRYAGGTPRLTFAHVPTVFMKLSDSVMGITVRGNHYGIFGADGSSWDGLGSSTFTNESTRDYFSVALLPDGSERTLRMFAGYAHNHVVGSDAQYKIADGHLVTEYNFEIETLGGSDTSGTLFATYPHQWKYLTTPLTDLVYKSVRGNMKLGTGDQFRTRLPLQGVLPMLPVAGSVDRQRLLGYLKQEVSRAKPKTADTYWEGKHLGRLATLAGIAEVLGEDRIEDQFVNEMQLRLEDWFVASPNETNGLFFYDKNWGTLIGSPASYGSDAELNDHHFHYGYFIRAAAEVARRNPEWGAQWGKMVDLLVRDIASGSAEDDLFPRLRCFDVYAGHSWASGHAKFGDGNNQESSSEAMNAWYGMMLWGEVTGNDLIRDRGVYLYNTERVAIEEYWFDVSSTNFPANFPEVALGMVWGGKGAFATWFSADIDCIHGINWLPFTPASIYMGRHPDYIKRNFDRITAKRKQGSDYNNGWGDLVVMFGALQDPAIGLTHLGKHPQCKIEEGNTHAFMFHWLQVLNRYGVNHAEVTSNHPFVNVFEKNGKNTYVAYNFDDAPLKVTFSDGTTLVANPGVLTIAE
ncbi:MAG: glycosyl hydrolase [Rubripirellula sp.]